MTADAAAAHPATGPTPEPATNWYHTRRHYSLTLVGDDTKGREGTSLCAPGGQPVEVFDEVSINRQLAPYREGKDPVVIADLPECARKIRKIAGGAGR